MSNMIKMRNVGAQTQKKWRFGGPPLEGRGDRRVEPGGKGPEGSGAQTWKKLGPQGLGSAGWGPEGSGGGGPKISRVFFPLPPTFSLFFSLWESFCGNLVVFDAPGPFKNTTKIQREDLQRERKRAKMEAGEGKKARNFGRSGGSGAGVPGRGSGAGGVRWRK